MLLLTLILMVVIQKLSYSEENPENLLLQNQTIHKLGDGTCPNR